LILSVGVSSPVSMPNWRQHRELLDLLDAGGVLRRRRSRCSSAHRSRPPHRVVERDQAEELTAIASPPLETSFRS
jgi:hypothetical protein